MRVSMGSDHAGYRLKEELKTFLQTEGHEVLDVGTDSEETVDYPDFCAAAARAVIDGRADRGAWRPSVHRAGWPGWARRPPWPRRPLRPVPGVDPG